MTLKEKLSAFKVYKGFHYLSKPQAFEALYESQKLPIVHLYDATIIKVDENNSYPIGYVGMFSWDGKTITPLDGDSYDSKMAIIATRVRKDDERQIFDVLVNGNW